MTNANAVSITVDLVDTYQDGFAGLRARWPEVTFETVREAGPGGHPEVQVSGAYDAVRRWLLADYTQGDERDADYYLHT